MMIDSLFDKWNELKKSINKSTKPKSPHKGKIYWISIGQNVGCETYGKGKDFARPVLVLSKIQIGYIDSFVGVPLRSKTKNKKGFMYYKFTDSKGNKQVALLAQIRVFDSKRILNPLDAEIKNDDFHQIKERLKQDILAF